MLEYKGYHAEYTFDAEDNYYTGRLYGIRDLVMFGGETEEELKADFYDAVEDYLEYCKDIGKEPNREKKSNDLDVRVNSDLYQSLAAASKNSKETFNSFIEKILADYVSKTA